MKVLMLKLSLKPGEYITLGDNIKIIFSGGSANNIHLLVDAPREINVARNSAGKDKKPSPYYKEKGISSIQTTSYGSDGRIKKWPIGFLDS